MSISNRKKYPSHPNLIKIKGGGVEQNMGNRCLLYFKNELRGQSLVVVTETTIISQRVQTIYGSKKMTYKLLYIFKQTMKKCALYNVLLKIL